MNMTPTQADGLKNLFAQLTPPLVEHDHEVRRNQRIIETLRAIQPHMKAMGDALNTPPQPARMDTLVAIETFIGCASPVERKHIINMLIERGVEVDGCATELEDATCAISRSIAAENDHA